jgi:hypothetical protein
MAHAYTVPGVRLPVFEKMHELAELDQPQIEIRLANRLEPKLMKTTIRMSESMPIDLIPCPHRIHFSMRAAILVHAPIATGDQM